MFEAQVQMIRAAYRITPGEVDLPLLPIFALFNPALGMTTVVPELDPRRPATLDPARIVQAIQQEGVTNSLGSPDPLEFDCHALSSHGHDVADVAPCAVCGSSGAGHAMAGSAARADPRSPAQSLRCD
jgi:hypothetical protein